MNNRYVECLYDIGDDKPLVESGSAVGELIKRLSLKETTLKAAQAIVKEITYSILKRHFTKNDNDSIVLMPILRSGLAMWEAANEFFECPESTFPICHKDKSTSNVFIMWPAQPNLANKKIIILDVILATGDTIKALCDHIEKKYAGCNVQITVVACYASPESINAILNHKKVASLLIGGRSKTVDKHGYLIPSTNGDIGDKLFGNKNLDYLHELDVDATKYAAANTQPTSASDTSQRNRFFNKM